MIEYDLIEMLHEMRENVVYMYFAEKLTPDFRTISDFRKNNPNLIKIAFKHTVNIAKNEGMLDLSHFSTDGTKIITSFKVVYILASTLSTL